MSLVSVVGMFWGDEGKGKVVDRLAEQADVVVRYAGGNNAGHTTYRDGRRVALHAFTMGILHPNVISVQAGGTVFPVDDAQRELESIGLCWADLEGRLLISDQATALFAYHRLQDGIAEARRGSEGIGTTGKGIGPAYAESRARDSIRMGEFRNIDFLERVRERSKSVNSALVSLGPSVCDQYHLEPIHVDSYIDDVRAMRERVLPFIKDTRSCLLDEWSAGARILMEGAQGTMLDIDQGTFPFVTSSNTTTAGICIGTGLPPQAIASGYILGVSKFYITRVGSGPFPTRGDDEWCSMMQQRALEFGVTTGRPRTVGYFDCVAGALSARVNGMHGLCITRVDDGDGAGDFKYARKYMRDAGGCAGSGMGSDGDGSGTSGSWFNVFPSSAAALEGVRGVLEPVSGWNGSKGVNAFENFPPPLLEYLEMIGQNVGCPVVAVSNGPDPSDLVLKQDIWAIAESFRHAAGKVGIVPPVYGGKYSMR